MSEFGPIDEYRDLFENAPCDYLTTGPDGRITKVNATLTAWTAFEADKFIGRRLHQFLNMAGRIYYETPIAPLLRMQGFFNEFALDLETAAGERLHDHVIDDDFIVRRAKKRGRLPDAHAAFGQTLSRLTIEKKA